MPATSDSIGSSHSQGSMPLVKVFRRKRVPVLLVRIWSRLSLDLRHRFLNPSCSIRPPGFDGLLIRPASFKEAILRDIETIPAGGRTLQSRIHVTCVVVFAVATQPQQPSHHQLWSVPIPRHIYRITDCLQTSGEVR